MMMIVMIIVMMMMIGLHNNVPKIHFQKIRLKILFGKIHCWKYLPLSSSIMIDVTNIELLSEPFQINDIRHLGLFLSDIFHVLTILKYQKSDPTDFFSIWTSKHDIYWQSLCHGCFQMFTKLRLWNWLFNMSNIHIKKLAWIFEDMFAKTIYNLFVIQIFNIFFCTKFCSSCLCFKIGFLKCIFWAFYGGLEMQTRNSENVMNDKMSIYDCAPTPALHCIQGQFCPKFICPRNVKIFWKKTKT